MKTSTILLGAGGVIAAYLLYQRFAASSASSQAVRAQSAPPGADAADVKGLFTGIIDKGLAAYKNATQSGLSDENAALRKVLRTSSPNVSYSRA